MKSDVSPRTLTGAPARVARVLLETGPITASEVAEKLALTGTAVRRHLDSLVDAGFAEASETAPPPAIERLRSIDPDRLTPREALDVLYELKSLLQ